MKVVISYDIENNDYEWVRDDTLHIRKDKTYDSINISFEYASEIIEQLDEVYYFNTETRRCEIYYLNEPPSELYIEIATFTDALLDSGEGSYQDMIPIKVYLDKPDKSSGISRYRYKINWEGNKLYIHKRKK